MLFQKESLKSVEPTRICVSSFVKKIEPLYHGLKVDLTTIINPISASKRT